jgi:hypothetical protein
MAPSQAAPQEAAVVEQPRVSVFDDIIENTAARKSAEWAKADLLMGRTYGKAIDNSPEMTAFKIACGRDFGFSPAQSIMFIYVYNNIPALYASGRSNLLVKAGYSWKVIKHDDTISHYRFYKHGDVMTDAEGKPLDVAFSMQDAIKAGYVENARGKASGDPKKDADRKGNYDKVPKNMLFARMITNFHRWHAPEVDGSAAADPSEVMELVVDETQRRIEAKTGDAVEDLKAKLAAVTTEVPSNAVA